MDHFQTLVSVGIPTFNRPEGIKTTLETISKQTYENLEIIVSDNGSPNKSVEQIVLEFVKLDPRILFFKQKRNLGANFNHQFVKDKAKGKYFMWAHDEDEFPVNYIEVCVKYLQENDKATLVGPSCDRYLDGKYWSTYENHDSSGLSTYYRLNNLLKDAFIYHWRFEQYFYGLWILSKGPKIVYPDFKTQFYLFFVLSEAGELIHAKELNIIKHTCQENLNSYITGVHYRRYKILSGFTRNTEECLPITLHMMYIILSSKNLKINEKFKLFLKILGLFKEHVILPEFRFNLRPKYLKFMGKPKIIGKRLFNYFKNKVLIII